MEIIRAMPCHVSRIYAIEMLSFGCPWSENSLLAAVNDPFGICLCGSEAGEVIGYVIGLSEGYIERIAVSPDFRRMGAGKALLAEFEKKAAPELLSLDVRASNTAGIALYESCGFERAGVRKDLYVSPREDGIVMIKKVSL